MNEINLHSENQPGMYPNEFYNNTGFNNQVYNHDTRRPFFHHGPGPFFGNPVFGFGVPFLGGLATGLLIDGAGGPPPFYPYPPYYSYPPYGYYPY